MPSDTERFVAILRATNPDAYVFEHQKPDTYTFDGDFDLTAAIRLLTPTASEATAIEAGEDISDAHRFLSLSSGFGHIPAADGKRMAGFFYSNDAAEAAGAMPAHAMSAIKRIVAAFATASPKIASDTAPGVRDRIGVENYFRCGFRAARYFFDPTIARGKSTPEEEDYTKWFMADYDALLASRPALAASPTASDTEKNDD